MPQLVKSNNLGCTFPRLMNTRTDRLPATLWTCSDGENVSVTWWGSFLLVSLSIMGNLSRFVFFNFTIEMFIALCCKTSGYDCKFIIKLTINLFSWLPLLMGWKCHYLVPRLKSCTQICVSLCLKWSLSWSVRDVAASALTPPPSLRLWPRLLH